MSDVVDLQQRASKAGRAFPRLVAQEDIDRASADEKRRADLRALGVLLCIGALACFYFGHLVVGWLFLGGYAATTLKRT